MSANDVLYQAVYSHLQRAIQIPDYGEARDTAYAFRQYLQNHGTWDALYFLNLCAYYLQNKDPNLQKLLEDIQAIEFKTLFHWTFQKALGQI